MHKILSIVIPTRNRSSYLAELLCCLVEEIEFSRCANRLEIVCVDNFSVDSTREVVAACSASNPYVRYCHQPESMASAEESMFSAVTFAQGDYVWTLGDDDLVSRGALSGILKVLESGVCGYILLNCAVVDYQNRIEALYFLDEGDPVNYETTQELFGEIGFVTHTTTISCLCFRRDLFDEVLCREFAAVSPIYSHSFALFVLYRNEPACFLRMPAVRFRMSQAGDELTHHASYQASRGHSSYWAFHVGLMKLILMASTRSGVPLSWFSKVQELEFSRFVMAVTPMRLASLMFRSILSQARLYRKNPAPRERITEEDFDHFAKFYEGSGLSGFLEDLGQMFVSKENNRSRGVLSEVFCTMKFARIEWGFLFQEMRHIARLELKLNVPCDRMKTEPPPAGIAGKLFSLIRDTYETMRKRGMLSCIVKFVNFLGGMNAFLLLRMLCHLKGIRPIRLARF